jgi:maltokinase
VYDALADGEGARLFGALVAPDLDLHKARPLAGDDAASSVVFDERWELRVYRPLVDGPNPDVEVPLALRRLGLDEVPTSVATWQRVNSDLAVMRRHIPRATPGDQVAGASVLEMLEMGCPPRMARADFRAHAEALGATVGRVHAAMAEAFGTDPARGSELADAMTIRALRTLRNPADAARVERSYRRLDGVTDVGTSMRIHGDLHLGRVVLGRRGWSVVDFSPDPELPTEERRERSSPLRDVASVLQSLHRVAADALDQHGLPEDDDEAAAELALLVEAWEERAAKAFISGYTSVDAVHQLLPSDRPARDALLAVFELNASIEQLGRRSGSGDSGATVIALRADHHPHRW